MPCAIYLKGNAVRRGTEHFSNTSVFEKMEHGKNHAAVRAEKATDGLLASYYSLLSSRLSCPARPSWRRQPLALPRFSWLGPAGRARCACHRGAAPGAAAAAPTATGTAATGASITSSCTIVIVATARSPPPCARPGDGHAPRAF